MERHKCHAVAMVDVIACVVLGLLVFSVAGPALARARDSSKLSRCSTNLEDIGMSCKIYANDNNENWPAPPSSVTAYDPGNDGIDYLAGAWVNDIPIEPGEVGYERESESTSFDLPDYTGGSTAVSTTRGYWMLVRSGDLVAETFVCPSTRDTADPTVVPMSYYDFSSYHNISYGYQMPFGLRGTRPQEWGDGGPAYAADKGPYYLDTFVPTFHTRRGVPVKWDSPQGRWRKYNSPNHRGRGQNVLYADGRVEFADTPARSFLLHLARTAIGLCREVGTRH